MRDDEVRRYLDDTVHCLQAPLTTVRTLLGRASQVKDQREVERLIEASRKEIEMLEALLAKLLLLAQLDAGALPEAAPLDLTAVAAESVDRLRPVADARRVQLLLASEQPVAASADPSQIRELLQILLENALQHTPAGGQVTVEVVSEKDTTRLTVSDSGIGIPREAQARIFERFFRVDKEESRRRGGVGLGLSIARRIAEAHGGRLTVESEPGKGSAFSLILKNVDA
jgi:signal transduction histidine kinase